MLDDQQRQAIRQRRQQLDDAGRLLRAHPGGGLVEQQHHGLPHQRQADLELALGAVGQGGHRDREMLGKAEPLGVRVRLLMQLRKSASGPPEDMADVVLQRAGERQVLSDREVTEQVVALEAARQPGARTDVRWCPAHVAAAHVHPARVGSDFPRDQIE